MTHFKGDNELKFSYQLYLLFMILILFSCSGKSPVPEGDAIKSRIDSLLASSNLSQNTKNDSLYKLLESVKVDSLKIQYVFDISYNYYKKNDSLPFFHWNKVSRNKSIKEADTARIAETYWDLGNFYYSRTQLDSSFANYNKAYNLYTKINDPLRASKMLYQIAVIQSNVGDYTGSEISVYKALQFIKDLEKYEVEYNLHNLMAINYNQLEQYFKSLEHHNIALNLLEKFESTNYTLATTLNNKGYVYKTMGNPEKAISIFNRAISIDSLSFKNPKVFAMLLGNKAHTKFEMGDTLGVMNLYRISSRIRDSIEHIDGIAINMRNMAEYYILKKDTLQAIDLVKESIALNRSSQNHVDILISYSLLSKIDVPNTEKHLQNYIQLKDSLQHQERLIRNKFTRIQFETDEFIAENKKLKNRQIYVAGFSAGIGILGLFGFVFIRQRIKNKKLQAETIQKVMNEKIFSLLIDQQRLKKQGSQKERKRISEELHDGILAKLFGIRLSLESLNTKLDPIAIELRKKYLKDLKDLGLELRNVSHDLNSSEFSTEAGYLHLIEQILNQPYKQPFSFSISNKGSIDWERVPGDIKMNLFRIIQEAIKNIQFHSSATGVIIIFGGNRAKLKLQIEDNGAGFDSTRNNPGIGITNMKSRAVAMGGELNITSTLGHGTQLNLSIPLQKRLSR